MFSIPAVRIVGNADIVGLLVSRISEKIDEVRGAFGHAPEYTKAVEFGNGVSCPLPLSRKIIFPENYFLAELKAVSVGKSSNKIV